MRVSRKPVAVLAAVMLLAATSTAVAADDVEAPHGAVGGVTDPAAGVLELTVYATDGGAGLLRATTALDGRTLDEAHFADATAVGSVTLKLPTTVVADGVHRLRVDVEDAAGNIAVLVDRDIRVANTPVVSTATVIVTVGSGGTPVTPSAGAASGCRSPSLSMMLDQRPLRFEDGVAVLAAGRKYRFRGRLTCRIDGHRRPAPRGMLVTPGAKVRADGRIVVRVASRSSRVITFRVRGADVAVRIPVRVG